MQHGHKISRNTSIPFHHPTSLFSSLIFCYPSIRWEPLRCFICSDGSNGTAYRFWRQPVPRLHQASRIDFLHLPPIEITASSWGPVWPCYYMNGGKRSYRDTGLWSTSKSQGTRFDFCFSFFGERRTLVVSGSQWPAIVATNYLSNWGCRDPTV